MLDVSEADSLRKMNERLQGSVIPNDVEDSFEEISKMRGAGYAPADLVPGDQIWFRNPYFYKLKPENRKNYPGEQGSNVFYIGGANVIAIYPDKRSGIHHVYTIDEYRQHIQDTFACVKDWNQIRGEEQGHSDPADFQIRRIKRPVVLAEDE